MDSGILSHNLLPWLDDVMTREITELVGALNFKLPHQHEAIRTTTYLMALSTQRIFSGITDKRTELTTLDNGFN